MNLNRLLPPARKRGSYDWDQQVRGGSAGTVEAHFGDVAGALERFLAGSESVVGCVAWVTSPRFIAALSGRPVALIVNKERWLRSADTKPSSARQRALLNRLTGGLNSIDFPQPLAGIGGVLDPVRCVGVAGGKYAPLMHSKFAVRLTGGVPTAVWTGSFNWSAGAESNIENALEVHHPLVALAYLEEFARVAALSEPLEFSHLKPAPQSEAKKASTARPRKPAVRKPPARKPVTKRVRKKPAATGRPPRPRRG